MLFEAVRVAENYFEYRSGGELGRPNPKPSPACGREMLERGPGLWGPLETLCADRQMRYEPS